jgi:phospho-N-acetylmuramoyl-pentapeptide-transferase
MELYMQMALLGAFISFVLTHSLIRWQRKEKIGQPIRDYGPDIHQHKQGTPTMGGLAIFATLGLIGIGLFLFGRLTASVLLVLAAALGSGLVGLLDDTLKFRKKNSDGLAGRYKLLLLTLLALGCSWFAYTQGIFNRPLAIPLVGAPWLAPLWLAITLALFVLIGTVNAVNFNDGLDGLAVGTTLISLSALAIIASGQGRMDLTGVLVIAIGIMLGFFWWNVFPAQIFLGDTGSFTLGGLVAATAIATRTEVFLPFIAFIPMIEVLSVMAQVMSFRILKKRLFKVAPLHHHFERAKGVSYTFYLPNVEWPESLITLRFWIIAALFALIGLAAYH